jgi:hypothetical protein
LSSFTCLFISSLRSDSSFCASSLNSLIILTFIFWNSIFDISSALLLFRCLVMELAFEVELLPFYFMFLHWDLHIWGYFWFKVPIPCVPIQTQGILWRNIQNWIMVDLWFSWL